MPTVGYKVVEGFERLVEYRLDAVRGGENRMTFGICHARVPAPSVWCKYLVLVSIVTVP